MAESQKVKELRAEIAKWQRKYIDLEKKQTALRNALTDLLGDTYEPFHYWDPED